MSIQLDHLILFVNDARLSVDFYERILGFAFEGERAPFSLLCVTDALTLQLAPWGTKGGEHLAFAMTQVSENKKDEEENKGAGTK